MNNLFYTRLHIPLLSPIMIMLPNNNTFNRIQLTRSIKHDIDQNKYADNIRTLDDLTDRTLYEKSSRRDTIVRASNKWSHKYTVAQYQEAITAYYRKDQKEEYVKAKSSIMSFDVAVQ